MTVKLNNATFLLQKGMPTRKIEYMICQVSVIAQPYKFNIVALVGSIQKVAKGAPIL